MCVIEYLWDLFIGHVEAIATLLLAAFTAIMARYTFKLAESTKKLADEARESS
jgi:hypothetical protein